MYRIKMLKYHGITPIMVFDGGFLPAKHKEEHRRHGYFFLTKLKIFYIYLNF